MRSRLASFISKRLKYEIMIFATFGLLASVATYSVASYAGEQLINKRLEPYIFARDTKSSIAKYQDFITTNRLNSKEWSKMRNWSSTDKRLFLLSVSGDKPVGSITGSNSKLPANRSLGVQLSANIQYTNAKVLTHFVYIRPRDMLHQMKTIITLLLSFGVFILVVYYYLNKKLNYIQVIERGVSILESGDMHYQLLVRGDDELSRLATSLNTMSRSFIEKDISEKLAIQTSKDIIGELSHDIRTPLTIISGYVPILIGDPTLSETQREYLNLIRLKTEQMNKRINDLLDYSVIYSGQQEIRKTLVLADNIISQLILELKHFPIKVENLTRKDTRIEVDEILISRVFDNLLSNIHKYADPIKELQLTCIEENQRLVISLRNRLRAAAVMDGKSLGLKISRYIMERHDGTLEVASDSEYFTTSLSLPLCKEGISDH